MKFVSIMPLHKSGVEEVLDIIRNESFDYLKHFTPYNWQDDSFVNAVNNKDKDQFYGIFINDYPVGFYMLRGLDAGYEIPSFAVWISEKHNGLGLASLALKHAYTICKLNGIKTMMLKVHPSNIIAKKMYERFGFKFNRKDVFSEDLIYHLNI
jgi:ribosomal protein S18 acetylase RimI-like enzyme